MDKWWKKYKVDVPEGKSGIWSVEKFEVPKRDANFFNMRQAINAHRGYRPIQPDTYTGLKREGAWDMIMSDTPAEISDHLEPILKAKGRVLINGLGLGMVLQAVLNKPEVEHVIVIEKSADVIQLVAEHYFKKFGHERLEIIESDSLEYQPPKGIKFDMVWHDIWDSICGDNYEDMKKLNRKYGRRKTQDGWQGCWCEYEVKRENHL